MPSCDPGPAPACLPAKTFRSYLPRCHRTYSCVHCRAHLAKHDELISKVTASITPTPALAPRLRPLQTLPGGDATEPGLPPPCPRGVFRERVIPGVKGSPQSPPAPCLRSPSRGAMAEPTCLTPCESAPLPRACVAVWVNSSPLCREGLSRPRWVPCALWVCLSFGGSPGELGCQALDSKRWGAGGRALSWVGRALSRCWALWAVLGVR